MYEVLNRFKELKHDDHVYEVGDTYPMEGAKSTKARIDELSTTKNKYNKPFIKEVETPKDKE